MKNKLIIALLTCITTSYSVATAPTTKMTKAEWIIHLQEEKYDIEISREQLTDTERKIAIKLWSEYSTLYKIWNDIFKLPQFKKFIINETEKQLHFISNPDHYQFFLLEDGYSPCDKCNEYNYNPCDEYNDIPSDILKDLLLQKFNETNETIAPILIKHCKNNSWTAEQIETYLLSTESAQLSYILFMKAVFSYMLVEIETKLKELES